MHTEEERGPDRSNAKRRLPEPTRRPERDELPGREKRTQPL